MNAVGINNDNVSGANGKRRSVDKYRTDPFCETKDFDVFVPISAPVGVSVLEGVFVKDDGNSRIRHSVFFKLAHDNLQMTKLCYVYTKCLIEKPMFTLYNKID